MVRRKKTVNCLLVFAMMLFLVLSACSSNQGEKTTEDTSTNEIKSTQIEETEEPYEITMAFIAFSMPKDIDLVEQEISKITKEKINATVDLMALSPSAFEQQRNLMLTSGEKLDLVFLNGGVYSSMVSKGQLLPLNDLLDKHGQGIKEALGPYLNVPQIDGELYAVPTLKEMAKGYGLMMRKDLVDQYQIDVESVKTLDDVEQVLKTIKENEPDMYPLYVNIPGTSILDNYLTVDDLSDRFGVLSDYDELNVVNYFEMPEYRALLDRVRKWYEAGYIVKDIATSQASKGEMISSGKAFAYFEPTKPGIALQNTKDVGQEMVVAEVIPPVSTTNTVTNVMFGLAGNSQNPERAMQFLNLLFTDADIVNLIDWGIEGKHYQKVSENVINYPEGVTAENNGYNLNQGWMFGNQLISYVWEGNDPEIWNKMKDFNDQAIKSVALGFVFNVEPVKTQYVAVKNVIEKYKVGLETGTLDPDEKYDEFINALKKAGIDEIIAEKQKQLDEWAASNK